MQAHTIRDIIVGAGAAAVVVTITIAWFTYHKASSDVSYENRIKLIKEMSEKTTKELQATITKQQSVIAKQDGKTADQQLDIDRLQRELLQSKNRESELEASLATETEKFAVQQRTAEKLRQENKQLKEVTKRFANEKGAIDKLRSELSQNKARQLEVAKTKAAEIAEKQAIITSREKELAQLKSKLSKSEADSTTAIQKKKELEKRITELRATIDEQKTTINKYKQEAEQRKQEAVVATVPTTSEDNEESAELVSLVIDKKETSAPPPANEAKPVAVDCAWREYITDSPQKIFESVDGKNEIVRKNQIEELFKGKGYRVKGSAKVEQFGNTIYVNFSLKDGDNRYTAAFKVLSEYRSLALKHTDGHALVAEGIIDGIYNHRINMHDAVIYQPEKTKDCLPLNHPESEPDIKKQLTKYFNYNSSTLSHSDLIEIYDFVVREKDLSDIVRIIGYADNYGNNDSNLTLAKRRAISVSNFLVNEGISENNIKSYGTTVTLGGRQDRKVEIAIYSSLPKDVDSCLGCAD